ncbi:MAG: penicillin-binding protein 2 [Hydrogenothermaceae bacterium]|nr:penicillin-binding protein 2 [Hydrogenothermaceae bacterium]
MAEFLKSRFGVVFILFFIVALTIVGRLFYLQIIKGQHYREISDRNYMRIFVTNPPRGRIYDRNGVLLAYDVPTFQLVCLPYIVKKNYKIEDFKKHMKDLLNIELTDKQVEIIQKNLYPQLVIQKSLSTQQMKTFWNYSYLFNGVYIDVVPKRVYTPEANYLPHVIGYVGYPSEKELQKNPDLNMNMLVGKAGVEKIFDSILRGKPGKRAVLVDAMGRQKKILWEEEPEKGNDVYLTIDIRLQKIAYESFVQSGNPSGAVVIVDPNSYEILTLLSYPTYDLQKFYEGMTKEEWQNLTSNIYKPLLNKVFSGLYPPGSIYKPLVSIAALEEGVLTPQTRILSRGEFNIGKYVYRNWDKRGCGYIDVSQALEMSCDTFYYQIGLKLGVDNIVKYTRGFGIGEKLNPDIESKTAIVPDRQWKRKVIKTGWFHGDTVNLSIGQGYIAITPFEATKIILPIINGGYVLKPNLLKAYFDNKTQKLIHSQREVIRRYNFKSYNVEAVKYGMYRVVYGPNGTAKVMATVPIKNAGKTGTAQVYSYMTRQKKHHRWELRDHGWFIDFAPYDQPKIAMAVFVEHGESGGKVAAPIAASILRKAYYEKILEE